MAKTFLAPFMIHELLLSPTEIASGSHPCRVVSVTYHRPSYFHGSNAGSNLVSDANSNQQLTFNLASLLHVTVCNVNSPWQNYEKCASGDEMGGTGKMVASAGESSDWVAW